MKNFNQQDRINCNAKLRDFLSYHDLIITQNVTSQECTKENLSEA